MQVLYYFNTYETNDTKLQTTKDIRIYINDSYLPHINRHDKNHTRLPAESVEVYLGVQSSFNLEASGVLKMHPANIIVNANYLEKPDGYLALLKLPEDINFSPTIKAISLPETSAPAGTVCTVTGWGATNSR